MIKITIVIMMAVAIIMVMLRDIVIMIKMIDNNDSYRNPQEICDDKDNNDDNSDKNDDQTVNAQITCYIYIKVVRL